MRRPGFNVADGNPRVKSRQRAAQSSRRVALHVDDIGLRIGHHRLQRRENPRRRRGQRLAGSHRVEIVIRNNAKDFQHLVEHLAMLRGHRDANIELRGPRLHVQNDGAELDGFRAGAEDEKGFQHACLTGPTTVVTLSDGGR